MFQKSKGAFSAAAPSLHPFQFGRALFQESQFEQEADWPVGLLMQVEFCRARKPKWEEHPHLVQTGVLKKYKQIGKPPGLSVSQFAYNGGRRAARKRGRICGKVVLFRLSWVLGMNFSPRCARLSSSSPPPPRLRRGGLNATAPEKSGPAFLKRIPETEGGVLGRSALRFFPVWAGALSGNSIRTRS